MVMNIRDMANQMGAASLERVMYRPTVNHVCYKGGQVATMRTVRMQRDADGTYYGKCEHCHRFFYSTPRGYNNNDTRIKQFAFA
jgi:hypothetical protein